jgi:polysaccharide export outer membrane protein
VELCRRCISVRVKTLDDNIGYVRVSTEIRINKIGCFHKSRPLLFLLVIELIASAGCYRPLITPKHIPKDLVAPHVTNAKAIDLSRLSGFASTKDFIEIGDVIEVTIIAGVSDQGPLSIPVRINDDGTALIPLLGAIPLAGMRIEQAEKIIRQQAMTGGVYRNPHVTVVLEIKDANKVTVIGAVEKPGTYDLPRSSSNLLTAFVAAGGLTSNASTNIEVRSPAQQAFPANPERQNRLATYTGGQQTAVPVSQSVRINLVSASNAGQGVNLRDGDVVMVPELDQNPIQVLGLVRKPADYELPSDRDLHLLDVLAMAGGLSSPVADKIYVIRRIPGEPETQVIKVSYQKAKRVRSENIRLASGDVVSVERTPMTVAFDAFTRFVNIGIGATARVPIF